MEVKVISDFQESWVAGRRREDKYKTWYVVKWFLNVLKVGMVGEWVAGKMVNDIFGFWKSEAGGEKRKCRVGEVELGRLVAAKDEWMEGR